MSDVRIIALGASLALAAAAPGAATTLPPSAVVAVATAAPAASAAPTASAAAEATPPATSTSGATTPDTPSAAPTTHAVATPAPLALAKLPVHAGAAPADQYFGQLKISPIGVRERIDALGRRYHDGSVDASDLEHDAAFDDQSLQVWAHEYPHDPWIAPTLFHLEQLDQFVQTPTARTAAIALLHEIAARYPKSSQAHLARLRLDQGLPPLDAAAPVGAQPASHAADASPAAAATPAGTAGAPAMAQPVSSASPGAHPSPL